MTRRAKITETTRSIYLGGREVVYVLRRTNRRRTIGLIVNHEGLKVASPWHVPMAEIYAMIEKSQDWVFNKLQVWQAQQPFVRRWVSGEKLYFLGREITLRVDIYSLGHGAFLSEDTLSAYAADAESVCRNVIAWYRDQALKRFHQRVAEIAPQLHVAPQRLILSNAKHQWGSCNSKGEVRLNWRLIQASSEVIDYVVIHELAHLQHMDHSPRFWATVESVCPQYRRLREELKEKDVLYRTI
ncbi:MAG: SprT family zinc-dependent metalloprotease [Pseudomonadota bacterium]